MQKHKFICLAAIWHAENPLRYNLQQTGYLPLGQTYITEEKEDGRRAA